MLRTMCLPCLPESRRTGRAEQFTARVHRFSGLLDSTDEDPYFAAELGIGVMATRLTLAQVLGVRLPDPQPSTRKSGYIRLAGFVLPQICHIFAK